MNRKMRAKRNNAEAKARKERKPCPNEDTLMPLGTGRCDTCGEELERVLVIPVGKDSNETVH